MNALEIIKNIQVENSSNLPKMSAKNKTILFVFSVSEGIVTLFTFTLGLFAGFN